MVSPYDYDIRIPTPNASAACFDQRVGKTEMKTKSNCASDGSVTVANGFFEVELYQLGTCVGISLNRIW